MEKVKHSESLQNVGGRAEIPFMLPSICLLITDSMKCLLGFFFFFLAFYLNLLQKWLKGNQMD